VEDAVLRLGQRGAPGVAGRIAEPPGSVKAARDPDPTTVLTSGSDAILAAVRLLALDVGDVRIGVALSDETGTLASGLATLRAGGPRKDAQAVAALVRQHGVDEVVVGLPLRLDGSLGPQGEKVMEFVARLRRMLLVPVVTRDERLTSVAAGERLAEAGVKRRDRKARLDQAAATLVLQELLDERKAVPLRGGEPR
jgi:putative holliday junction resolvase